MDLANQITPTPDHEPHAAVRMLRAASGFYRSDAHLFYVTGDGRIFLVSAPGEPVCLRPWDILPDEAQAVSITSAAHLLLADTAEQLASPAGPYLRADVGRDARVLAASMLQDLLDIAKDEIGGLLLEDRPACIDALNDRVADLVTTSRAHRRRLSNQRANARGLSPSHPPPPLATPRFAVPFRHRGDYLGWFVGMRMAGETLGFASVRDAHLRGDLWTLAKGGIVHVFRCGLAHHELEPAAMSAAV
jgi:hypothetical protein